MKVRTKFLMITVLITLFLGMFFHNEAFAVPDYGEPGSYNTAFSIELICKSLENYEKDMSGDYGYETRVYSEKILEKDFYVKIASLVDMGETIETSSFGILNYVGTEEIVGRHCYIYTVDITDKTIFENKIVEDLRYSEYNFKFYYEISIERKIEDIIIGNEIEDGLIESFESYEYEDWIDEEMTQSQIIQACSFTFNPSKLIKLLNNTSKLDSLVQNDSYVYDYVYFRLTGEQNNAKIKYADNTEKSLEIVTINSTQYAKCPIGVIKKTDNQYYPGCFSWAGKDTFGLHCDGYIGFYNNNAKIQNLRFFAGIFPESYNSCSIELQSESLIDYELDVTSDHGCEGKVYDNRIIEENCYIKLSSDVYAGETIEVYPFGTLNYNGTEKEYDSTKYVYKMAVTDKTIFNKNIVGRVLSEEYNIIFVYEISFDNNVSQDLTGFEVIVRPFETVFTGRAIEPEVVIQNNGNQLILGEDYTINYENNINVGNATVTIQGKGQYSGTINKTFRIVQKYISELQDVTIGEYNKAFDNKEKKPTVNLKYDKIDLELNKDYTVQYAGNINAGTATLIINGIGNYAGTITKNFEIEAKDIATLTDIVINPCYEAYTGYPIYVSEGIKDGENELSNGWDYVIEYEDNINPGTATVIIKGQNNYKGEILRTYEIAKRDISNLIINVNTDDYIYTGEAIEPPVEIIYDGRVLKLNEDYEVNYENNINVGTATVTIIGIGYYKGTVEKKIEIYKKSEFVYWKVCSRDYRYDYPYEYGLYEYLSKNNIDVSQVSEIIFNNIKKTENVINSNISLDVSKNSDKSVMVYVLENKLYIQYEGILKLDNAIGLFTGFKNVTHIKGLEHIDTSEVTSMWCMFNGCESLLEIDVSSFDTSNVTNMQSMFCDCFKIKKIDLSNFNTEHVQSMGFMFENDYWLEELNLNGFNTRAVTNMRSMFYNCIWLRRVDLTSFDTRNVTSMDRMFYKSGLEELDLSSFDTSKVTDMSDMFWYASSLTKIYVSKMWNVEGVRDSSSMFGGNTKLSGNNGTNYDSSIERDKTYARIDSYYIPGYLSAKIDIKSDMYNLEKDYIYISNQQFDLSKIETTNCTKVIEDNILYINYEDILIRKYYIINILSEHYDIGEDNIVVFEEDVDLDKINITNASKEILNDILYIKFQDKVVKEYKINMPYDGFVLDNTVTYNGQAYGIKLKESNPYNIKVKYADKNGNYTLTEMPKYSDAGTYKINYMLYVENNNGTVKGYKTLTIKKADIKYVSNNKTVTYNGNGFGIDLNVENPKNVLIRYADKNGNYTLTEMPKYYDVGIFKIKYKIYINDNYNEIKSENTLTINKANINNSSTNYEGIYDGKEHSINVKVDIPNYDIKYSVNNNEYNSNTLPSFKEVGDYTVNYKITSPNYNDLIGSNRVRIYGVKKLDSTLEIRNNMLIVKNYKNNFTDLCNRIQLHANSKSYLHLNQNKNTINDLLVKTGEYIQLLINNSSTLEYKVSILADVNGDGKISALDYVKIKNHIMKTNLINSDVYLTAADVNDDGKISALDYVRIKNYIMNGGV